MQHNLLLAYHCPPLINIRYKRTFEVHTFTINRHIGHLEQMMFQLAKVTLAVSRMMMMTTRKTRMPGSA
jgi:hypothetical protein